MLKWIARLYVSWLGVYLQWCKPDFRKVRLPRWLERHILAEIDRRSRGRRT